MTVKMIRKEPEYNGTTWIRACVDTKGFFVGFVTGSSEYEIKMEALKYEVKPMGFFINDTWRGRVLKRLNL